MATEIDFKDDMDMPMESKRAMTTAALFTSIFQKYLETNRCEYVTDEEEQKQFAAELLDHVIIVGGFCRDVLLNRPVNDIDIVINLRELTKLQTNHLKKYHSKTSEQDMNCRCVYWQRYLHKLRGMNLDAAFVEAQQKLPELQMMHNLDYILNANFWIGVLRADKSLDNKMSVKDFPVNGYHSAQIVGTVVYGDIDCDHQRIDIIDTFHVDKALQHDESDAKLVEAFHRKSRQLSMSGLDITRDDLGQGGGMASADSAQNKSRQEVPAASAGPIGGGGGGRRGAGGKGKHGRLASMAMIDVSIDQMGSSFGFGNKSRDEQQYIAIEVPIYSGKVRYKLLNYDFSINTCILPLSNIIKLKDYNNEDANSSDERMTWVEIIENGLGECDGIEDCTLEKILRSPEHDHCSILAHPQTYVFWRIVRWKIREPDFKVDTGLLQAQQEDFGRWLKPEWFAAVENRAKFMTFLKHTLERDCKEISDVRQMLSVMQDLEFTQQFAQVLQQSQVVRQKLTETIVNCSNGNLARNAVKQAFGEHELATMSEDELRDLGGNREAELEEQLYEAQRKLTSTKETLNGTMMQLQRAKDEINDLRGDREEVQRLRKELKAVKQELEELEEEKDGKEVEVVRLTDQASRLMTEAKEGKKLKKEELPRLRKDYEELQAEHEQLKESKQQLAMRLAESMNQLRDYLIEYQTIIATKTNK